MLRRFANLVVGLLVAALPATSGAHVHGGRLRENDQWAVYGLRKFAELGFDVGQGTTKGLDVPTGYVQVVTRLPEWFRQVQEWVDAPAFTERDRGYAVLREANAYQKTAREVGALLPTVIRAIRAYRGEFMASKQDPVAAARQVRGLEARIEGLRVPRLDEAFQNLPDIPVNHWIYQGIVAMKKVGLMVGYPDGRWRGPRPPLTPIDIADMFSYCRLPIESVCTRIFEGVNACAFDHSGSDWVKEHLEYGRQWLEDDHVPQAFEFIERACRTFPAALRFQGLDPSALSTRMVSARALVKRLRVPPVGSALKPFSDVPADHWAAKATADLRREGILWGDGDGRFRG